MPKHKQTFIITEMRKTRVEVEIDSPDFARGSLELGLFLNGLANLNPLGVFPLKWEDHQYTVDIEQEGE